MPMYNTIYSYADATGDRMDVDVVVYDDNLDSFIFTINPADRGYDAEAGIITTQVAVLVPPEQVRELVRKLSIELEVADLDMPNT